MTSPAAPPGRDEPSSLFDFLPIGAYRSLPSGGLLRANPALVRMNGVASEAALVAAVGTDVDRWYLQPGRRAEFRARLERDGHVQAFVSQVRRQCDGAPIWVSENAHLIRDADGRIVCYEGTVEDVTDRVQAAADLERSERRLREITSQVPGMVYRLTLGADGRRRFSFVSEGVRSLFGLSPQAVLDDGELLGRFEHPSDRERLMAEARRSRAGGAPLDTEFRIVLADGSQKWVHLVASSVQSDEAGLVRVGVMLDVSARHAAERALREHEERWTHALDALGDGRWEVDLGSGRAVVSPRLLEMYGIAPQDFDGSSDHLDRLTHPDDIERMRDDRRRHIAGETPWYVNEHRMRTADGRWKWVLSRGIVIERDADGRPLRLVGTHTDISERKEAESLRAERDRSAAAQKAQTQFLSRVSHELRTPLNAVMGFAQLLAAAQRPDDPHRAWVRAIVDSGSHLLALVNDLLDLSATQTGMLAFHLADVDVAKLVRDAWPAHATAAVGAGLTFVDRLPAGGDCVVRADPTRLRQVVDNLLSNAVKYNRPGGRVVVGAGRHEHTVELSVADDGPGIPEAQRARLFQPFERLGAQHSAIAGTGLGLALARHLVEAMGGTIGVDSAPGHGAVFRVRLSART